MPHAKFHGFRCEIFGHTFKPKYHHSWQSRRQRPTIVGTLTGADAGGYQDVQVPCSRCGTLFALCKVPERTSCQEAGLRQQLNDIRKILE